MPDEAKIIDAESLKWVGTRPIRPDGVDKVTGKARFGADFSLPLANHILDLAEDGAYDVPVCC